MDILLDTANVKAIEKLWAKLPLKGVTTNPSILSAEGGDPYKTLKKIREIIGDGDLHVQVLSEDSDDIVEEAKRITSNLGKNTLIKIPATLSGLKAIKTLSSMGYRTTATAVFTLSQGILAAKAGAEYIAPYINRIDNAGGNGVEVASEIDNACSMYLLDTKVVGASFKNVRQVEELIKNNVSAATLPLDIIEKMFTVSGTDDAIKKFKKDWERLDFGPTL